MPDYDYTCSKCNKVYTKTRGMAEKDPGYTCEDDTCNAELNRVYLAVGTVFKGSGFYKTDNK